MPEVQTDAAATGMRMPQTWQSAGALQVRLEKHLRLSARPLLICDYDGTLAPFQQDKMKAVPYDGVAQVLEAIVKGRTRLAFVSGRPVDELMRLLPLAADAEVWGMHGRQHRMPNGQQRVLEPTGQQRAALDEAETSLRGQGYALLVERKIASVALHWRSIDPETEAERLSMVQEATEAAFAPHVGKHGLGVLPFDGGLELRAEDHTKGHAVEALLGGVAGETEPAGCVFLGDDTTDEDAFAVLQAKGGLGILVRTPARPSYAQCSLAPPEQLLEFLKAWERATRGAADARGANSYTGDREAGRR